MSEDKKKDSVTFETLGDAINFVESKGKVAEQASAGFIQSFAELTGGYDPRQQVSALDVVRICFSLYGEPKKND